MDPPRRSWRRRTRRASARARREHRRAGAGRAHAARPSAASGTRPLTRWSAADAPRWGWRKLSSMMWRAISATPSRNRPALLQRAVSRRRPTLGRVAVAIMRCSVPAARAPLDGVHPFLHGTDCVPAWCGFPPSDGGTVLEAPAREWREGREQILAGGREVVLDPDPGTSGKTRREIRPSRSSRRSVTTSIRGETPSRCAQELVEAVRAVGQLGEDRDAPLRRQQHADGGL